MKTTIDIPDDLFRRTKATAALEGKTLKEFVSAALREMLARRSRGRIRPSDSGWRSVFGRAQPGQLRELDEIIESEFSRIEPESWR